VKKLLALVMMCTPALAAQTIPTVKVSQLPAASSAGASDLLQITTASPLTSKKITVTNFIASITATGLYAPMARIITCTPPLLCNGGASMDLSANRTLSITEHVYNVRSPPYGALGNAINDDTAEIQAAIDAAEVTGGVVYLPRGQYKISAALNVDASASSQASVRIVGDGQDATMLLLASSTADGIVFGSATAYATCGGVEHLSFYSTVTRTAGSAIVVDGCSQGRITDLTIQTSGGHGLEFGRTSSRLAVIWMVSDVTIGLAGAFDGIRLLSGNDRYFTNVFIAGNQTTGSRAIYVKNSGGDWFNNIEAVLADVGVLVAPGTGDQVSWPTFYNILADTNKTVGFKFDPSGTGVIRGVTCVACWASSNGAASTSGRGFLLNGGLEYLFSSPRAVNNGGHGLEIGAVNGVSISGGFFSGNSLGSSGTLSGISLGATSSHVRITGTRSGQTASLSNSQKYGIDITAGADNYQVVGNDLTSNLTGGLNNAPGLAATRIAAGNMPLVAASESLSGVGACSANQFATTLNGGSAPTCAQPSFANLSSSLACSQVPAFTGDVTTSAGSCATTLANIPTATPAAGTIVVTNTAAPSSPASGKVSLFTDSTALRLHDKNASGVIGTTVVADTGAANNFLTGITAAGAITKARPSMADLSDGATIASGTYTPAITAVTNVAASTAYSAQWLRVGNVVTVSGKVDIDPTAAGASATAFHVSLPVASNFTAGQNCAGLATVYSIGTPVTILADATNDRANLEYTSPDGVNRPLVFTFTYVVQ